MTRIINLWEHNTWGDSVCWFSAATRTLVGWLTPRPQVGDEVRAKVEGGGIAHFRITEMDTHYAPSDQFFATVECIAKYEVVKEGVAE